MVWLYTNSRQCLVILIHLALFGKPLSVMTYAELHDKVAKKEIVAAIDKAGKKSRLFVSKCGTLCVFFPKSSRRGFRLSSVENFVRYLAPVPPVEPNSDAALRKSYNVIARYKKLAQEATFSNSWVEACKALPSFEDWKHDTVLPFGKTTDADRRLKTLYDLEITTGNSIDGKVITLDRLARQFQYDILALRKAIRGEADSILPPTVIKERTFFSRRPFAGYEATCSLKRFEDGSLMGYLSLEYKDCCNGYYYLLINDNTFIGYDVA